MEKICSSLSLLFIAIFPLCQKEDQCDMKRPSKGSVFLEPSLIVAIIQSDNLTFCYNYLWSLFLWVQIEQKHIKWLGWAGTKFGVKYWCVCLRNTAMSVWEILPCLCEKYWPVPTQMKFPLSILSCVPRPTTGWSSLNRVERPIDRRE